MIQSQQVQDRGVQVVDVDFVLGRVIAVVVGARRSARPPLTPPPASHIVKPSGLWSRPSVAFGRRRAAELAAPQHQRVVEQAPGLQIGSSPAIGRSTSRAFFSCPSFRSPCWSHCTCCRCG